MVCTDQAQNPPWAWSPCLTHGQHFHLPMKLQFLLLWSQLHIPLPVFLQWQNTSDKLIRSTLPDTTHKSQVSKCFLKRPRPTANPAPPSQNTIRWKGKCMPGIFRGVNKRKKMFRYLLYIKAQIHMTRKKKNDKTKDCSVWIQATQLVWMWLYHWGLFCCWGFFVCVFVWLVFVSVWVSFLVVSFSTRCVV